jgi:hypothetical protein
MVFSLQAMRKDLWSLREGFSTIELMIEFGGPGNLAKNANFTERETDTMPRIGQLATISCT